MNYSKYKALLIDIDDTIVRFKDEVKEDIHPITGQPVRTTASLMNVLHAAGVELSGLSLEEVSRRIETIKAEIQWWHWSDFIVALELNPKEFWSYALESERKYLEPTGPEIQAALDRLRSSNILLYITSNNPSSGILHKLNVAGIATVNGSTMFSQLLGGTELHAMKWEPIYWRKVLAHIALNPDDVAVIGDNPKDDYLIPHSVGINHSFLVDRYCDRSIENSDTVTYVKDFTEIADCVLGKRRTNGHTLPPTLKSRLGSTEPAHA